MRGQFMVESEYNFHVLERESFGDVASGFSFVEESDFIGSKVLNFGNVFESFKCPGRLLWVLLRHHFIVAKLNKKVIEIFIREFSQVVVKKCFKNRFYFSEMREKFN